MPAPTPDRSVQMALNHLRLAFRSYMDGVTKNKVQFALIVQNNTVPSKIADLLREYADQIEDGQLYTHTFVQEGSAGFVHLHKELTNDKQ